MIRTGVALSALLAVGAFGPALAQEQLESPAVTGTIQSIDESTRTVVLDNGQSYTMGESADLDSLEEGSDVDLSCDAAGTNCMVVTADMQNDMGPETETAPSAGTGGGEAEEAVPPSSTAPESTTDGDTDTSGSDGTN